MPSAEAELATRDPDLLNVILNSDSGARILGELRDRFSLPMWRRMAKRSSYGTSRDCATGTPDGCMSASVCLGSISGNARSTDEWAACPQGQAAGVDCRVLQAAGVSCSRQAVPNVDSLRGRSSRRGSCRAEHNGLVLQTRVGWRLRDAEFHRYARLFWEARASSPEASLFPEALLQRVDDGWMTELPSADEAFVYLANEAYIRALMARLGERSGEALSDWPSMYSPACPAVAHNAGFEAGPPTTT